MKFSYFQRKLTISENSIAIRKIEQFQEPGFSLNHREKLLKNELSITMSIGKPTNSDVIKTERKLEIPLL